MAKVTVYGASDDLIEIEGAIRDEFSPRGDTGYLSFSDGSVLRVNYGDDGLWRVERVINGRARYEKTFTAVDPDSKEYSDRAELDGDVQWVVFGSSMPRVKPAAARLEAAGRE